MAAPPLVVIEGGSPTALAAARAELLASGWPLVEGCSGARPGVVCAARIDSSRAAQHAVLAAVAGAGLLLEADAEREVLDLCYEDLRRLGTLDLRFGDPDAGPYLGPDERSLLELLLGGSSLGQAARTLHLSRRTADRRLASARRQLGAASTPEALVLASAAGVRSQPS